MLAARSTSASRSTIIGSLPPSSSDAGISRSAAATATLRPVRVEPVKWIMSTFSTSAAPVRAGAGRDQEDIRRRAALEHRVGEHQVGQRGDLARLQHHRVARHQRRDAVAEAVRERVVPGPDHAHDPVGAVAHEHLLAEQQQRVGLDPLVGQVLGRLLGPEAERVAHVEELREQRVLARLAVLLHEQVDHAVAVLGRTSCRSSSITSARPSKPERLPGRLRAAGALDQRLHLLGAHVVDVADHLARGRVLDGDLPARCRRRPVRLGGGLGLLER